MGTFHSLEEARTFFKGDTFAAANGMVIDALGEDFAVCSMTVGPDHKNAYGGVMGGVLFTLADFTFAVLSNQIHRITVAQQVSVNFFSQPKGQRLIARGVLKKNGRNSSVINVEMRDDTGREILQFVGTGFKLSEKE